MAIAHNLFGLLGDATALFLFFAPVPTFKTIRRSNSTQQFSGIPYVVTLLNCLVSAWYGLPFVSEDNFLVLAINVTGALIETIYVVLFIFYANNNQLKIKMIGLLMLVITVFAALALYSSLALDGGTRTRFCGYVAAFGTVCMYASPLIAMCSVIRNNSVQFMPFWVSLFGFLCATSWFVYGLIGGDHFLSVPNGFGCLFGAVQLIVYFRYHDNQGNDETRESLLE